MKEVPEAVPKIKVLFDRLREQSEEHDPNAERWLALLRPALTKPQSHGTLKAWASKHNREETETLQATFDAEHHLLKMWEPGIRTMSWNPLGVKFLVQGEPVSERRYRRLWTLTATDLVFIGYDRDFLQIVAYHPLVSEPQKV